MSRTIALVGTAPSYEGVFERIGTTGYEVWTINRVVMNGMIEPDVVDRMIEIHYPWFAVNEYSGLGLDYGEWLSRRHPFPIYMMEEYDEYPSSVRFPLEDVLVDVFSGLYRDGRPARRTASSFDYAMGLAIFERPQRIELHGFEMRNDEPYRAQRETALLLIGNAQGKGIEVDCSKEFRLYDGDLYGYEAVNMIGRLTFEADRVKYLNERERASSEVMHHQGQKFEIAKQIEQNAGDEELLPELTKKYREIEEAKTLAEKRAIAYDAISQYIDHKIAECDQMEVPEEIVDRFGKLK